MNTPMQELISEMEKSPLMFASALTLIEHMKMLEKEKEVIENAYWDGGQWVPTSGSQCEEYYNETFNTKEK
jgi:hypothetical protein